MSDTAARTITLFPSLTNTDGTQAVLTWSELGERLSKPAARPKRVDDPSLGGWSPATFREGQRQNSNVVEITALCMDVDEGAVSLEGIVAAPRWRLVVATSRSMGPDEHARAWRHLRDHLAERGVIVDAHTKDPSRFWFLPVEPMEGAFEFRSIEGEPFDVDATPEAPMSNAEPTTNAYGEAALKRACRTIARSSVGDRGDTLNKEAFSIAQLVAGGVIAEHVAMDRLSAAAKAADLKTDETTRTLASAMAAGKQQPRQAPALRASAKHVSQNHVCLDVDAKGTPKKIVANILTVFARDPRWNGVIGYDTFRETPVLLR